MYESMTFEAIMARCMSRVSGRVDRREGGVIYDALAPACAELAIIYTELSVLLDRAFVDTATGDDLTKKCSERAIIRRSATYASRRGYFENADGVGYEVTIGTRFSGGGLNYTAVRRLSPGQYELIAETAGTGGNTFFGSLFPIDYCEGMAVATLGEVLVYGEDEEDDTTLRARYYASLESQAYGGNIADYVDKVGKLDGVGGVKVFPVWNGGGTVKVVFLTSEGTAPSDTLIEQVQTVVDPVQNHGEGVGIAPIGHTVTCVGATEVQIDVTASLTFDSGASWNALKPDIEKAVRDYFAAQTEEWAVSENLVVRVSQIEAAIMGVEGVVDISGTTINGGTANIVLDEESFPVLGGLTNGPS